MQKARRETIRPANITGNDKKREEGGLQETSTAVKETFTHMKGPRKALRNGNSDAKKSGILLGAARLGGARGNRNKKGA